MYKTWLLVATTIVSLHVFPARLTAQWEDAAVIATLADESVLSCLDRAPASSFARMLVFVQALPRDEVNMQFSNADTIHVNEALLASEDGFVAAVADRIKHELGASGDSIPTAGQRMTWRGLDARVWITLHRAGQVQIVSSGQRDTRADMVGQRLLKDAVDSVQASAAKLQWPVAQQGDSLTFGVSFISPTVDSAGTASQVYARKAFPAFSIAEPWFQKARLVHAGRRSYPYPAAREGYAASVTVGFIVDSTGNVMDGSLTTTGLHGQHLSNT